jgi:hypothetical protein
MSFHIQRDGRPIVRGQKVGKQFLLMAVFSLLLAAAPAQAEPPKPIASDLDLTSNQELKTMPDDLGFGEHDVARFSYFRPDAEVGGKVDRRATNDSMSDRGLIFPLALLPPKGTLQYDNYRIQGNAISYSVSDEQQFSVLGVIGSGEIDNFLGLSMKRSLSRGKNSALSFQISGLHRNGNDEMSTRDLGAGLSLLYDRLVTNDFLISVGLQGYLTLWYGYDRVDFETCPSRAAFLNDECQEQVEESETLPSGGHWLRANLTGVYYISEKLTLRTELITGVAAGTFLSAEGLYQEESLAEQRQRFEQGEIGLGIPFGHKLTTGVGIAWSNGKYGAFFSFYFLPTLDDSSDDPFLIQPVIGGTARF